jgi:AraC-like DNA-binding protein
MFSAVARIGSGPVELVVGMAIERRFRLFAIDRRGLTFDTRFAPPIDGASDAVIVYLLLEGSMGWGDGTRVTGPALFLMAEKDFEGARGARGRFFRSWGTPFRCVELRVAPADCAVALDAGRAILPLEGADDLVSAGRLYLHASHAKKGQHFVASLAATYLGELERRGILAAPLSSTIVADEGIRGVLWGAMRPAVERFGATAKQDVLTSRVGWNARRLQRELVRVATAHGVAWLGNWREVVHRYRVRVAVLLLSNPQLPVGEVASWVGYSSVEALSHAFEAIGLPAPTAVRRAILSGDDACELTRA